MDDDDNEKRGFKVEDRRRFSASGDAREESRAEPPVREDASQVPPSTADMRATPPSPEMTFSTFVISLVTQALILLGEIPDPAGQNAAADLTAAKQLIDILGILQSKTKGNLDEGEAGLLENALYDLRMQYVQRSRSK